jgi:hypothetical protein
VAEKLKVEVEIRCDIRAGRGAKKGLVVEKTEKVATE